VNFESVQTATRQTGLRRALERLLPLLLVLLVPLLVLTGDRSLIFNFSGYLDPWIYYALFRNLSALKTLFPGTYYASRLSLILPGYVINRLFAPLVANYALHLLVWLAAIAGLYVTVKHIAGRRSAIMAATIFGFFPYLWKAVGWDYPDGIGNAYYLLTTAALTLAACNEKASRRYLLLAGITAAAAVYSNLTWAFLLPSLGPYWIFLRKARSSRVAVGRALLYSAGGFLLLTMVFAVVNDRLSGTYFFYLPSIAYALNGVQAQTASAAKDMRWIATSPWLYLPAAAVVSGLASLVRVRWHDADFHARMTVALYVNLLFCAGVLIAWELAGQPLLQISYYASYLLAPTFLFLGVTAFSVSEKLGTETFCALLAVVIALCSWIWWDPGGTTWRWTMSFGVAPLGAIAIASVVIGSGLVRGTVGLMAVALGIALLSLTARSPGTAIWWAGHSARQTEDAFRRIAKAIEIGAETARPAKMLYFWYDSADKNAAEFSSINSSYLYLYAKVASDYPTPPNSLPEGLTAILSSLPDDQRASVLVQTRASLRRIGIESRVVSEHVIARGGVRYAMTFVRFAINMATVKANGYIRNGDFESGSEPWDSGWATLHLIDGGQSGMALALDATEGTGQYAMQRNFGRLELGRKYRFVVWTKSGSSGDERFEVGIWDDTASRFVVSREGRTSGQWKRQEIDFVNNSGRPLSVELAKKSPSKGTMLFDSVSLTEVK
jgi:hypothetical protein